MAGPATEQKTVEHRIVRTADLARILGVTPATVTAWKNNGVIAQYGEDDSQPGRAANTYDLDGVLDDLRSAGDYYLPFADNLERYLIKVRTPSVREMVEDLRSINGNHAEPEPEPEPDLDDVMRYVEELELLVISLAKALHDEDSHLTNEQHLRILDIVLTHVEIQD